MARDKNTLEYRKLREVNNFDDADYPISYVGTEHPDGDWMIKKLDETSGLIVTYATSKLNPSYGKGDYSTVWTNRADLSYSTISNAL